MNSDKQRIADLIRTAFAGVRLGRGVGLWEGQGLDDYADERTLETLRAKDEKEDWTRISAADLDRCYSSLSFFDEAGMRFHLPAYLTADLAHELQTADVLFHLTHPGHNAPQKFDFLSPEQRAAVREFLLLRLGDPLREFDHPSIERALQEYWNEVD
jgi:hypothetical protein